MVHPYPQDHQWSSSHQADLADHASDYGQLGLVDVMMIIDDLEGMDGAWAIFPQQFPFR